MSQLPISADNSTSFHNMPITNGIIFALEDMSLNDEEKYACASFLC